MSTITESKTTKRPTVYLIILATLLITVGFASPYQSYASNNNDDNDNDSKNPLSDLLRWGAGGLEEYNAGAQAGRQAAQNDFYAGSSSGASCPGEAGNWCAGYNTGYNNVMNDLESALR